MVAVCIVYMRTGSQCLHSVRAPDKTAGLLFLLLSLLLLLMVVVVVVVDK